MWGLNSLNDIQRLYKIYLHVSDLQVIAGSKDNNNIQMYLHISDPEVIPDSKNNNIIQNVFTYFRSWS